MKCQARDSDYRPTENNNISSNCAHCVHGSVTIQLYHTAQRWWLLLRDECQTSNYRSAYTYRLHPCDRFDISVVTRRAETADSPCHHSVPWYCTTPLIMLWNYGWRESRLKGLGPAWSWPLRRIYTLSSTYISTCSKSVWSDCFYLSFRQVFIKLY